MKLFIFTLIFSLSLSICAAQNTSATTQAKIGVNIYPNPIKNVANISFAVKEADNYTIKIYNIFGKEVLTVSNKYYDIGTYKYKIKFDRFPKGMYFFIFEGKNLYLSKKVYK